jgi:hypothetical protein
VELPYGVVRGLAWWVASELIRRHPDQLRVIETHPGGGQYDCLSIYHRRRNQESALIVHLNLLGHLTHGTWFGAPEGGEGDNRFNWFEVLNARDRRSYVVKQLEAAAGLPSPNATPETTRRSIGPRALARFAASAALTTKRWSIVNGFLDTSYDAAVRTQYFEAFPGARLEPLRGDLLGQPAYRYWFVVDHRDRPQAAVDAERGLAWPFGDTGPGIDLLSRYRAAHSTIDHVVREVLPPIE